MVNDELGKRMKHNYEEVSKTRLVRRMPVAIRIDGRAFHTFTRGFEKPFDMILVKSMQYTTKWLCENIQGCVFGYTQSDEITLILVDYQNLESSAWFDYEVQKLCSIAASMATMKFNQIFQINCAPIIEAGEWNSYIEARYKACQKGAMFDARCFNIPKEEVTNLIYWRQLDAIRNSIQMVGQDNFSHKYLQGLSCNDIKQELRKKADCQNWEDYPIFLQRGTAVRKEYLSRQDLVTGEIIDTKEWIIDVNMPILKGEDREYVDDLIRVGE